MVPEKAEGRMPVGSRTKGPCPSPAALNPGCRISRRPCHDGTVTAHYSGLLWDRRAAGGLDTGYYAVCLLRIVYGRADKPQACMARTVTIRTWPVPL